MKTLQKIILICLILCSQHIWAKTDQLIIDQYYSPFMGASLNQSAYRAYMYLDDKYLTSSQGKNSILWTAGRIGKLVLEEAASEFLMVVQHEVFGHGYRLREYHFKNIGYKLGIGTGWTGFSDEEFATLSYSRRAALSAAGMEANSVFSAQIRQNWIVNNSIDRREALLYWVTAFDQPNYILSTYGSADSDGNDVNAYIAEVNSWYGNKRLTNNKLSSYTLWDLLDPSMYLGIYSLGKYIIDGSPNVKMYMFDVGRYKYLFSPRLLLTPYGPEFQLQNYVLNPSNQLWQVNLRFGNNNHIHSYGLDVLLRSIWQYRGAKFGNKLYLWKQPKFLKQNYAAGVAQAMGVADVVSAEYDLRKNFSLVGEFGYKTAGYIQGFALGNSWVWRLGLRLMY